MEKLFAIFALLLASVIASAGEPKDSDKESAKGSIKGGIKENTAVNETAQPSDLYAEILKMDTLFFDAFNRQDLNTIKVLFAEDLEFYHDKGGFSDYQKNMEASKRLFENNKTLRRELIRETMKVYPIKDYGALQIGEHKFCHVENGKNDCGVFQFTHIWRKVGDSWQLARVISYDH